MIRLYDRLTRRCHSINHLNKLHIALENQLTPAEVVKLSDHLIGQNQISWLNGYAGIVFGRLDRKLPTGIFPVFRGRCRSHIRIGHSKRWIELLRNRLPAKPEEYNPDLGFERRTVRGNIRLYSAAGSKADKILLVALSGNAGRLMMPTPFFLACLNSSAIDVALLRTRKKAGYRDGVPGLSANTLEKSVGEIEEALQTSRYRQVVVLGTSGGALPSIYVAAWLRADAVLATGVNNPNDNRWTTYLQGRDMGSWLLGPGGEDPALKTRIYLVAGQDHKRDVQSVCRLNDLVGAAAVIQVPNCGHNPLYPLYQSQALSRLLSETILAKHMNITGLTGNVTYQ